MAEIFGKEMVGRNEIKLFKNILVGCFCDKSILPESHVSLLFQNDHVMSVYVRDTRPQEMKISLVAEAYDILESNDRIILYCLWSMEINVM